MCLSVDKKETKLIEKRFREAKKRGKNYIICYKELCIITNESLISPYRNKVYKIGWNKSNRATNKISIKEKKQMI